MLSKGEDVLGRKSEDRRDRQQVAEFFFEFETRSVRELTGYDSPSLTREWVLCI